MRFRFHAAAEAELAAAIAWYEDRRTGAGDDLTRAIESAVWLLVELPEMWPQWPGAPSGVRRCVVAGSMYSIAYVVFGDEVVVLAVAHQRRRPGYWFKRTP